MFAIRFGAIHDFVMVTGGLIVNHPTFDEPKANKFS
jgi:hypothetical protein